MTNNYCITCWSFHDCRLFLNTSCCKDGYLRLINDWCANQVTERPKIGYCKGSSLIIFNCQLIFTCSFRTLTDRIRNLIGLSKSITNMPLSIRLSWNPNPEKDLAGYGVECSDESDGSFRKWVTVTALRDGKPSAKEMALSSGAVRYYRIKALDREGLESDWSVIGHGRAKPVPDAPVTLTVEQVESNVRVTWKASVQPDVRRYKVWSKKFLGWKLISALEQTSYLFEFTELSKPMTIAVSAVDRDELESKKSESIEIRPGI